MQTQILFHQCKFNSSNLPMGRGSRPGEGAGGQGTFHPPCHVVHYHMVLRPEGTSHKVCVIVRTPAETLTPPVRSVAVVAGRFRS